MLRLEYIPVFEGRIKSALKALLRSEQLHILNKEPNFKFIYTGVYYENGHQNGGCPEINKFYHQNQPFLLSSAYVTDSDYVFIELNNAYFEVFRKEFRKVTLYTIFIFEEK